MMKENYLITIDGRMEGPDGSKDSVQLMTKGSFVQKNDKFFISYSETAATGFEGCITTVKVEGASRVSMTRYGPLPHSLVVEKGRRHICHYETGHGSMNLGVSADEIHNRLSDCGGTVRFSYMLDTDAVSLSRNIVKITVKPAN